MIDNIMLTTDSYKCSHYKQYPPNTQYVYSYFESRGGRFKETVFFGLQYFIKKYLVGNVVNEVKLQEARCYWQKHFGKDVFNYEGWKYILERHEGRLPIAIRAVEEGTVVPTSNVLMTVHNTDPNCYWLTNFLETLLVQVWYPCTVATQSREMKKLIWGALKETGTESQEALAYKLHDFGFRGVTCPEQAGIGGAAHLINFDGTDTFAGPLMIEQYYTDYNSEDFYGHSIPASEHSTITSWGEENELEAMRNMLRQYPDGLVACVSDSFDIYRACRDYWGTALKDEILQRDGCLVVRPDSGYPPEVVLKVLEILGEKFGTKENEKGYKVLNPKVRVIQGDGIDFDMIQSILNQMRFSGWSADNIAFGSGGGLLQKMDRDTQKFAFKCSYIKVDGAGRDVYKNPVTDTGKQSKRGYLALKKTEGGYETESYDYGSHHTFYEGDCLNEVFYNGYIVKDISFGEVRENARLREEV